MEHGVGYYHTEIPIYPIFYLLRGIIVGNVGLGLRNYLHNLGLYKSAIWGIKSVIAYEASSRNESVCTSTNACAGRLKVTEP